LPKPACSPECEVMPVLNSIPFDTTIPGHTRRRTWSHPELTSHSVLVLTYDRFYLAPLSGTPKSESLAAIEAGVDLDDLLGPLTTVIDLENIRQLTLELVVNSLTIEYVGRGMKRSRVRLTFATPEAADACFTKIWRRLGADFQLAPYKRDAWHSMRSPLLVLATILIITAAMSGILSIHEDMPSTHMHQPNQSTTGVSSARVDAAKSTWSSLLGWMNWRVVCGLGGVAAACSQVWLYRRLTTPPESLELIKT
jgi:hypothetical protein